MSDLSDQLEIDYGTPILEELTGETLTRKSQPVKLFDESSRTSEHYYPDDGRGKPYVQNHKEGKRWYPLTAYMETHNVDWRTALSELSARYLGNDALNNNYNTAPRTRPTPVAVSPAPVSYHDPSYVLRTLEGYERNNFVIYLRRLFGVPVVDTLLSRFGIGTGQHWNVSPHWPRSTIFWQVDQKGRVHGGKVIYYSPASGRRVKEKKNEYPPNWIHALTGLADFHYQPCFFGLHQLHGEPDNKRIAVVESEKTAIIASAFFPQFTWLASGGLTTLSPEMCNVLKGRDLTLFPDLNGFSKWKIKAEQIRTVVGREIEVSTFLEERATVLERDAGYDLADFLTRYRCPDSGRVLTEPEGYPALWDCEPLDSTPSIRVQSLNEYLTETIDARP